MEYVCRHNIKSYHQVTGRICGLKRREIYDHQLY